MKRSHRKQRRLHAHPADAEPAERQADCLRSKFHAGTNLIEFDLVGAADYSEIGPAVSRTLLLACRSRRGARLRGPADPLDSSGSA